MWANDPVLARRFEDHTPKGTKLPEKVKEAGVAGALLDAAKGVGTSVGLASPAVGSAVLQNSAIKDEIAGKITPMTGIKSHIGQTLADGVDNSTAVDTTNLAAVGGGKLLQLSRFIPKGTAPKMFSLGMGAKTLGASVVTNAVNNAIPGAAAPTDLTAVLNEPWWKSQVRNVRNVGAGFTGGLPAGGWGAVPGAIMGGLKEPSNAIDAALAQRDLATLAKSRAVDANLDLLRKDPSAWSRNTPGVGSVESNIRKLDPSRLPDAHRALNWDALRPTLLPAAGILGAGAVGYGLHRLFSPKKKEPMLTPKIAKWIWQPDMAATPAPVANANAPMGMQSPTAAPPAAPTDTPPAKPTPPPALPVLPSLPKLPKVGHFKIVRWMI